MKRTGSVYVHDLKAGTLVEEEDGYVFTYDPEYAGRTNPPPVSLTMPVRTEPYKSRTMFPALDGLIPEGWLLLIAERNWKLNVRDRMGLLLACCHDCIGAVSIRPIPEKNNA